MSVKQIYVPPDNDITSNHEPSDIKDIPQATSKSFQRREWIKRQKRQNHKLHGISKTRDKRTEVNSNLDMTEIEKLRLNLQKKMKQGFQLQDLTKTSQESAPMHRTSQHANGSSSSKGKTSTNGSYWQAVIFKPNQTQSARNPQDNKHKGSLKQGNVFKSDEHRLHDEDIITLFKQLHSTCQLENGGYDTKATDMVDDAFITTKSNQDTAAATKDSTDVTADTTNNNTDITSPPPPPTTTTTTTKENKQCVTAKYNKDVTLSARESKQSVSPDNNDDTSKREKNISTPVNAGGSYTLSMLNEENGDNCNSKTLSSKPSTDLLPVLGNKGHTNLQSSRKETRLSKETLPKAIQKSFHRAPTSVKMKTNYFKSKQLHINHPLQFCNSRSRESSFVNSKSAALDHVPPHLDRLLRRLSRMSAMDVTKSSRSDCKSLKSTSSDTFVDVESSHAQTTMQSDKKKTLSAGNLSIDASPKSSKSSPSQGFISLPPIEHLKKTVSTQTGSAIEEVARANSYVNNGHFPSIPKDTNNHYPGKLPDVQYCDSKTQVEFWDQDPDWGYRSPCNTRPGSVFHNGEVINNVHGQGFDQLEYSKTFLNYDLWD